MYVTAPQRFQFGQPCHDILQTHKTLLIHLGLHRIQPSLVHEVPEAVGSTAEHKVSKLSRTKSVLYIHP
jgi:hypothetical protein